MSRAEAGAQRAPVFRLLLMILLAAETNMHAQTGDTEVLPGQPMSVPADSGRPGGTDALDEQITGAEDDEDIELPRGDDIPGRGSGRRRFRWRTRVSGKLQPGRGYTTGAYAGDRMKIYNRLRVTEGKWFSAGLLTEKDPGESRLSDHLTGSLAFGGPGDAVGVMLGDFRIASGQGLVFSNGRSFGKGAEVIAPAMRRGWGVTSSPTADETNFFRGSAARATAGPVSLVAFVSRRSRSAVLGEDGSIASLDETGYHRTTAEIGNMDRVTQWSHGAAARFEPGNVPGSGLGLNYLGSVFSTVRRDGVGDDASSPPARRVVDRTISVDFTITTPVVLYGEVAWHAGGVSGLAGALFAPVPGVGVVLVGRAYPAGGGFGRVSVFGDRTGGRNENGMYAGVDLRPVPGLRMRGYLDVFSTPEPTREVVFPGRGVDRFLGMTAGEGSDLEIEARYRERSVEKREPPGGDGTGSVPRNLSVTENRWRLEAGWKGGPRLHTRMRVELSRVSPGTSSSADGGPDYGFMIMADMGVEPVRRLALKFRVIFFSTDSYAARLYETEADLPGSLTSGVVHGRGTRWYLLSTWNAADALRISARYACLTLDDRRRIGSGAEEITGNIEERVGLQLDVGF